jgi:NADH dehydrogenase [ubiquinone] 1 alpha subcomplex assembly factor 7
VATALGDRLRARIRQDGPLPFAEWMDACLYDPDGGFYTQAAHPAGTGPGSDFATSPALHPFFAECVARELADAWRRAGSPARWTVAEFGAGTGALARDAAAALRAEGVPVDWVAIDVRAGPPAAGVRWAEQAPAGIDAAVANEFLDAVPFDLHEWQAGQWWRVGVGLGAASTFAWARLGPSRVAMPPGRDGERRVVMPAVPLWVRELARLGARCAVIADYGAAGPARDVRAYRGHASADALDEPGTADITADVDFALLRQQAASAGFTALAETQEEFLLRHGVLDELNAVDRSSVEGASSYLRLRQLLLPTGLGAAFKVVRLDRTA